ncbi:MAG TPA: PAS domain S-box protein [Cytophagaceae bacterium]|jgi:PAS domain S-box-containing protein|nr:PAS domain S-box protein [Cytophagaceae bacterium]
MSKANQLQKQLEISEKRFQTVAQTATDAIVIANHLSGIIFFNKKAQEIFQYTEEEIIGKNLTILMHERYKEAHRNGVKRFLATEKPKLIGHVIEIMALKKDGVEFPIELSLSSWKEDSEYFFSGIIRDISERRKAQEEMELLQNITQAISGTDDFYSALKTTIEKVCKVTGWDFGEAWVAADEEGTRIKYAPVWYYSDEKLKEFAEESSKLLLSPGQGMSGRIFQNNTEWRLDVSTGPANDFKRAGLAYKAGLKASLGVPIVANNKVLAAIVFFMFETKEEDTHLIKLVSSVAGQLGTLMQRKMAEEALRKAHQELEKRVQERTSELSSINERLEKEVESRKKIEDTLRINNWELKKSNTDLDNFIYIASHDLKVPLINMEALLTILKEEMENQSDDVKDVMHKFEKSLLRMQHTLSDISNVARIQKNLEESSDKILFQDVLYEVIESIEELITQTKTNITADFSACPQIHYSRINLKSILYNFVTNAIKYRSPERTPVIKICSQLHHEHPILIVKDNGLGLDLTKHREKLFGMFKRFHDHVEGSGIGLYIVKRMVENKGGKVDVESEPGKGSSFKVIF